MNVAEQSQQVLVLVANNRFVPPLEQVANFAIAAVEILRVRLLQPLHKFAERLRAALKEQVHVIRHQAVGVDSEMKPGAVVLQSVKVSFVIVVATECSSSLITADDDMVKKTRRKDSGTASHSGRDIQKNITAGKIVVIVMSDPISHISLTIFDPTSLTCGSDAQ
jgi:predicted trehalose synthase